MLTVWPSLGDRSSGGKNTESPPWQQGSMEPSFHEPNCGLRTENQPSSGRIAKSASVIDQF
jgi:hypothetical protein